MCTGFWFTSWPIGNHHTHLCKKCQLSWCSRFLLLNWACGFSKERIYSTSGCYLVKLIDMSFWDGRLHTGWPSTGSGEEEARSCHPRSLEHILGQGQGSLANLFPPKARNCVTPGGREKSIAHDTCGGQVCLLNIVSWQNCKFDEFQPWLACDLLMSILEIADFLLQPVFEVKIDSTSILVSSTLDSFILSSTWLKCKA